MSRNARAKQKAIANNTLAVLESVRGEKKRKMESDVG